jgi:hypothetical protein
MRVCAIALSVLFSSNLQAQRTFEKNHHVIYEDAQKRQSDLGIGSKPILTNGKVLMIRGEPSGPNTDFDCNDQHKKNWISVLDPVTRSEKTLFDAPVHFDDRLIPAGYCIFEGVALSPDGQILYVVGPVYATSGSLAVIRLKTKNVTIVAGVNEVYVIETGSHRGELVYSARRYHRDPHDNNQYPYYPFIHAQADGKEIGVISEEDLAVGGPKYWNLPVLAAYLKQLGGRITVNGDRFP